MKKISVLFVVVLLLQLFWVAGTFAQAGDPVGGCPTGFTLMEVMDHDQHEHTHVGLKVDLNQDGWLCMQPVTPDGKYHVHIDNTVPLP